MSQTSTTGVDPRLIHYCRVERSLMSREAIEEMREIMKLYRLLFTIIAVLILLLNGIVILIFALMSKVRQKIPNYLLFVQASVDIFYGVKLFLDLIPGYQPSLHFLIKNDSYQKTKSYLGDMVQYAAIGNIILTALERFMALRKPFFHRRFVTWKKVLFATIALLLASGTIAQINIYADKAEVKYVFNIFDSVLMLTAGVVVLTLLIMTYLTIQKSVQAKLNEARSAIDLDRNQDGHYVRLIKAEHAKESRLVSLFITIAIAYIVGILPYSIFIMTYERYIHGGGQRWDQLTHFKVQLFFFALSISPAIFDPALTLYLKYDYHEYIRKAIGAIYRNIQECSRICPGHMRLGRAITGL